MIEDSSIYRSPQAQAAIHDLYDRARDAPAARALFEDVKTVLISDSGHILTADGAARLSPRLAAFFSR